MYSKLLLLLYKNNRNAENNSSGFTLLEVIASTVMGFILLGFAFSGFLTLRQTFVNDTSVSNVNQRLKTIFASIGPDMQQIGEGLTSTSLPLVEISQNATTNSSEITLRRTIIPQSLTLCHDVVAGTSDSVIVFDKGASCGVGDFEEIDADKNTDGWPDTVKLWKDKRINTVGTIRAYIYGSDPSNPNNKRGEFFDYNGEVFDVSPVKSNKTATPATPATIPNTATLKNSSLTNAYAQGSVIYLMDQRQYKVEEENYNGKDIRKLILTVNDTDRFELTEYMEKLDITATLVKETTTGGVTTTTEHLCQVISDTGPANCTPSFANPTTDYKFSQIKSIEVKATVLQQGEEDLNSNNVNGKRENEDFSMSQKFFIRNTIN